MFASRARSYRPVLAAEGCPQTRALTLLAQAQHFFGEQARTHGFGRVDVRVAAHRLIQQWRGRVVGVGEEQGVGQLGDGLGLQHEVDERAGVARVRRIGGNGQGVEPDQRAFARNAVEHFEGLPGLGSTRSGHAGVAGVGQRQAGFALGQIIDLPGIADVAQVRLQHREQVLAATRKLFAAIETFKGEAQGMADKLLDELRIGLS